MKFSDITGHTGEIRKLTSLVDSGKLPHALLFHGQSGIGKTRVARAFIQYLFCTDRQNGDSCGRCPACLQTAKLNNPDIHYIFPIVKGNPPRSISSEYFQEWKEFLSECSYMAPEEWMKKIEAGNSRPMIYVTESEEILRQASLSSYGDGFKVFLVWQPEKMNAEAANKLLKIIEEPFSDTIFVFISNSPGEIISTIRSRLQSVEFNPLSDEEIRNYFIHKGKSEAEATSLARISKGNMNVAAGLAESSGEMANFAKDFIEVMRACYARKMDQLKGLSDRFYGYGREKAMRLLVYFARMIRESFISNLDCSRLEAMTDGEKAFVAKFGPFINAANVIPMAEEIDRAREDIARNANQKIVWFDLFIELTRLIRTNPSFKK